jgi:hypothetical protein
MQTIKAGDTILVTIPKLKIQLAKVKVKAVTQLPGKMIAVELPEPVSHHDCDGFCAPKQGYWVLPQQIVHARNEEEGKRMLAEAAKLAEVEKPRQMAIKIDQGQYQLVEAPK